MKPDVFNQGRVGIVGVGAMGRPLIDRLRARDFDVTAYVRRKTQARELADVGFAIADSIADLGKGRDFVIVYVYSDEQVRDVCLGDGLVEAMERDAVLIIHTTSSPVTVREIGEQAQARGVRVVDAGGAWAPTYTGLGEMALMLGGEPEDIARCTPVLETYAYPLHHMGPLGAGMCMKLINNAVLGVHLQAATEVIRLGRELGLDSYRLLRGLTYCTGGSTAMHLMATAVTEERFWDYGGRFFHKDLQVVESLAAELGLDLGLIGALNRPLIERLGQQLDRPSH